MIPLPDRHQVIDISRLISLEIVRKIQGRLNQKLLRRQIQRDHQSPQPPVAVQERVDGFKLIVSDGDPDQGRDYHLFAMQEFFEIPHQVRNMVMVRRNEGGIFQADTDPVLADAKLARPLGLAFYALQQYGMRLTQQSIGQG